MKKLKRAIVREEYVALTGDYTDAIILNQFIYWSERTKDFDNFIEEEKKRYQNEGIEITINLTNGWIYKKAEELAEETMTYLAKANMRTRLKKLIDKGWLEERNNPYLKWDKTKQYRVNLIKISKDLFDLGYTIQDYKFDICEVTNRNFEHIENETSKSRIETSKSRIETSESRIETSESRIETAIPQITTEITTKITIHTQEIKELCVEIHQILGEKSLGQKKVQELINDSSIEVVKQYMSNWDKYRPYAKKTQSAYFIYCIQHEIPVPQPQQTTTYNNSIVPQYANFDQREYTEDFLKQFMNNDD